MTGCGCLCHTEPDVKHVAACCVPEAYVTPYQRMPEWMHENIPPMPVEERTERVEGTRERLRNLITHEKTPESDTQRVLKNTHERTDTMKIHTLELPMEHVGEFSRTPYALIISGCTPMQRDRIMSDPTGTLTDLMKGDNPYKPAYILTLTDEVDTP